jgi:DNA modification methylase
MSYNEIMQALENGFKVHWINSAYRVLLDNGKLYCIYEYNSYMAALVEAEYMDCFIKGI